jgi:hypothetical protein
MVAKVTPPQAQGQGSDGGANASPVLLCLQRRVRAAKKKAARIQELETSGKPLTAEQVGSPFGSFFSLCTVVSDLRFSRGDRGLHAGFHGCAKVVGSG